MRVCFNWQNFPDNNFLTRKHCDVFWSRLSPYEWQETSNSEDSETNDNSNFSVMNSLWYGAGALMQQGSDITPRSISTR